MSEFINDNPAVLDDSLLPKRNEDGIEEVLWPESRIDNSMYRKRLLLKLDGSTESSVFKDIELLGKLLQISEVPDLATDDSDEQEEADPVDAQEIYDLIAHISDPEHPLSLGQLSIVTLEDIEVKDSGSEDDIAEVVIHITPTISHCSLATLIGLGIRVRLERALSPRFRITILLKKGSHTSENQVNKQLNDKERVAAACENEQLLQVVSKMLSTCK